MEPQYIKKVQEWVECDNKILKHKQEMKVHQEKKQLLEDDILEYIEAKGLSNIKLAISDGNIKFSKRNTTQPLSMKILRTALESFPEPVNAEAFIAHVAGLLETKQKVSMSRHLNTSESS